tara:strand:+ start:13598 stop:13858 length:261 start_codon:yes stop_codon:yes gene_type:complete
MFEKIKEIEKLTSNLVIQTQDLRDEVFALVGLPELLTKQEIETEDELVEESDVDIDILKNNDYDGSIDQANDDYQRSEINALLRDN